MLFKKNSPVRLIQLTILGIFMTFVGFVLGAPFFRVVRNTYGSLTFWSIAFGLILVMAYFGNWNLASIYCSLILTVGVSTELELLKLPLIIKNLISTILGWFVLMVGVFWWTQKNSITNIERAAEFLKEALKPVIQNTNKVELDYVGMVYQLPSAGFILIMVGLALSLVWERRIRFWFRLKKIRSVKGHSFMNLKWNDYVIWLALFSLLFTIIDWKENSNLYWIGIVSANLTNILIVIFSFQGLSILENLLLQMHSGMFFRTLSYFIFFGQMFLLLSFVGFVDYWIDFRSKIAKMRDQKKTR